MTSAVGLPTLSDTIAVITYAVRLRPARARAELS